tara:strand:- start:1973 stop:2461 length:489 start_codon:yes stop_codon:yes gene_type:complete
MSKSANANLAGRIWKIGLGLSLIAVGSFFVWWLWAVWDKAGDMDDWQEAPGQIIASSVADWRYNEFSRLEYEPRVRYRFQVGTKDYVGERIRRVSIRSTSSAKAKKWIERYPAGESVTVYFDPDDPQLSVLKRDTKASLYSIWFPFLFVVGGAGMVFSAVRP